MTGNTEVIEIPEELPTRRIFRQFVDHDEPDIIIDDVNDDAIIITGTKIGRGPATPELVEPEPITQEEMSDIEEEPQPPPPAQPPSPIRDWAWHAAKVREWFKKNRPTSEEIAEQYEFREPDPEEEDRPGYLETGECDDEPESDSESESETEDEVELVPNAMGYGTAFRHPEPDEFPEWSPFPLYVDAMVDFYLKNPKPNPHVGNSY